MKVCGLQSSLDLDLWIRIVHLYFEDSLVASESKEPTCQCRRHIRHRSDPCLGQEEALEKEIATHSNILAWRIPWTEESAGLHSMGSHRVGHGWVTTHTHTHYIYCFSQDLIILFYLFGFFKSFNTSLKCDISSSQWRRLWLLGTLSLLFFFLHCHSLSAPVTFGQAGRVSPSLHMTSLGCRYCQTQRDAGVSAVLGNTLRDQSH